MEGALTPTGAGLQYRVLGGLSVTDGVRQLDLSTPKQRCVLAVLLLERDRVVSVDRLIELLWGDASDKALASLQSYVSRLRTALEPSRQRRDASTVLVSQSPGYRLAVARADVDLYRFEDEVAAGVAQLHAGDHAGALATLDTALAAWAGPLLPEFAAEPFVVVAAERAERIRLSAVEAAGEARLALGDHSGAVVSLEPDAERHPDRERLQGLLALALYRSARQADALRVVARCRQALAESVGLDPGPELRRIEADLLAQAPALDWQPPAVTARVEAPTEPLATQVVGAAVPPRRGLVGREYELGVLETALAAAEAGRGGVAIVVGEPGIGKTRLTEALVERAAERGVATAWARCPESRAAPPFWAVTQLADGLRAAGLIDQRVDAVDSFAAAGVQERFGLYRAVLDTIAEVDCPLVLVIDDLQWADPDSLRLLEHIAADLGATRALVLATMRPLADDSPDALVDCLAEVARVAGGIQVALDGLHVDAVASWLADRAGGVPRAVVEIVHDRTGGNPLFIKELTELLAAEGRLDDATAARSARTIPPGVQFVVRRRVSRLPPSSQKLLTVAAVIGRTLDLDAVAAAASTDVADVLDAVAPAFDAGLLVESAGELAFSHALVADALAGEVNAVRRATIHAAVALRLAERSGSGFGLAAAAITHHALEGILAGTGELAISAGTAAARLAEARFADEDAAGHWADVAAALARSRPSDVGARLAVLLERARALTRTDMVAAAKQPILEAVGMAHAVGMIDAMADVASLLNNLHVWTNESYGIVDGEVVAALELTLAAGRHDDRTRAILLGALAAELVFGDPRRHLEVSLEAEATARAAGDPATLARVLSNVIAPMGPDSLERRERQSAEILELAVTNELGPDFVFVALHHVAGQCFERGDLDGAVAATGRAKRTIEAMPGQRLHAQQLWLEAMTALTVGRYDEAAELGAKAHELHRRGRHYNADVLYLAGVAGVALDRGGLEEMVPFMLQTAGTDDYERATSESMAFGMLEAGRADLAAAMIAPFGSDAPWPGDWTTLFCQAAALHVRIELDDRAAADAVAPLLAAYTLRWAHAGTTPISLGPVALAVARHAQMHDDDAAAAARYADAVAMCERMSAPAWLARSLLHQGAFLRARGERMDGAAALIRSRDLATRHRLPYVQRRLDVLDG